MSESTSADLQRTLHTELPISAHLGVRVLSAGPGSVELAAPLGANRNHKGTVFGGSLNAVATLAAWSWCWVFLELREIQAEVVVQDSTISYHRPVTADFTARCAAPGRDDEERFLGALRRSGRGRVRLSVEIRDAAGVAVSFTGRFVAETVT
jgi:thioesterase domain-containing protein